jgi:cellulose synthase/poly-beta-1,6-N-acetylglucosamine synthase-like glycosyltransferase
MMVFAILISILYFLLLMYYLIGWNRVKIFSETNESYEKTISIVVPARNEEKNISTTLRQIIEQDYPDHLYEIIIIDDSSDDETISLAEKEILKHSKKPEIRLIKLADGKAGKKQAIEEGVKSSRGDFIIVTDADCVRKKGWLKSISAFAAHTQAKFISAPVCFYKEEKVFEKMQSLEFSSLIGIGAACIGNNSPTMCNGANMAFDKNAFVEVEGYAGVDDVASGDDEFLMHKIHKKYPNQVKFIKHKEAIVSTKAKKNLKDFWMQRRRWVSKSTKYKNPIEQGMQVCVWLFHLALMLSFPFAQFGILPFESFILLLLVKLFAEVFFFIPVLKFFSKHVYLYWYPLSALLYVFYVVTIAFSAFGGTYFWKGRQVR